MPRAHVCLPFRSYGLGRITRCGPLSASKLASVAPLPVVCFELSSAFPPQAPMAESPQSCSRLQRRNILMEGTHLIADPILDRDIEHKFERFAATHRAQALAGPSGMCADLDRYDIAVVLQAVYEWGGYRYTNASAAIAAAKRGRK